MDSLKGFFLLLTICGFLSALPCRFAAKFDANRILSSESARDEFLDHIVHYEGRFMRSVGLGDALAMTKDGTRLHLDSGESFQGHNFTAPSKESIHVALLALAVAGNARALALFGNSSAVHELLRRKVSSLEAFNAEYPGFGGFLPWVQVDGKSIKPTWDWVDRVPSLDNGQLAWSSIVVSHALGLSSDPAAVKLGVRWRAVWERMAQNSRIVFYSGGGKVRTVTKVLDTKVAPFAANYEGEPCPSPPCYLDDPYEGELMTTFMELTGALNKTEADQLWALKRKKIQPVNLTTPLGDITVQKGWWFSAHESWKFMLAPYRRVAVMERLLKNQERARTWWSKMHGFPGMFASVTLPVTNDSQQLQYGSGCGVPPLAFAPVGDQSVVTPYSSFPLALASLPEGLVWYHSMLKGPRMQNCFGSTESWNFSSSAISPVVTWDSKITTVLAMLGGVGPLAADALEKEGYLDRFLARIDAEYSAVFSSMSGEDIPYALPDLDRPCSDVSFPDCSTSADSCSS